MLLRASTFRVRLRRNGMLCLQLNLNVSQRQTSDEEEAEMPGRSAVVAALLLIGSPLKEQVSITTGNCTPNAAALEDRVACFVMGYSYIETSLVTWD